jgi:hypothetical protein
MMGLSEEVMLVQRMELSELERLLGLYRVSSLAMSAQQSAKG